MKTYVIYRKDPQGKEEYLKPDNTFSDKLEDAKEYKVRWLVDLLNVLLKIVLALANAGVLKFRQK